MLNTKLCLIGYAAAQERQYSRLVKQMKPDLEEYQEQKEKLFVFYNFFFVSILDLYDFKSNFSGTIFQIR